ncbi:MAG: hypothetical protein IH940_06395, partial [Acidobacteria bacterium]|nr:hypothetical protein [Acidobacteriota bacterium]
MTEALALRELELLSVTKLKGVGDRKAAALEGAEISSVLDLLTHYPRRYIDRTKEATIAELGVGEEG